ncbi:hypothetical protein A9K71_25925 [Mesorhizobium sp. WSM3873]|nr:hypothetical protein A9K71_25925 [Mesorhizobium sp. WSM3873]
MFATQVKIAVREAGAESEPDRWLGGEQGRRQVNARGRGAGSAAGLRRDGGGWGRKGGSGRFRARRLMVKARLVKFASQRGARVPEVRRVSTRAVDAHLRYLQPSEAHSYLEKRFAERRTHLLTRR